MFIIPLDGDLDEHRRLVTREDKMLSRKPFFVGAVSVLSVALSACGGGGGGGHVASIPPPPPPSPPTPTPAGYTVNIFPDPKPETYATVGIAGAQYSTADADQLHIRYTAGGFYELQVPGKDYSRLAFPTNVIPQDPGTFNYFVTANGDSVAIEVARLQGYRYSEIANGLSAFGSATPAGGVPVAGSASYSGIVRGGSDIMQDDFLVGGQVPVPVTGSVSLLFNFAAGSLGGSMTLRTDPYANPVELGTFAFKDTVYSSGALTYSGTFATAAAGHNLFVGRFTGPSAQETIGAWALPFVYPVDGQVHQARGAWIAKKP